MKKILKFFILIFTFFSLFNMSSCYSKLTKIEVPVTKYVIINDDGLFGGSVVQFYVSEEFKYDLDLLKDIKIKFSYKQGSTLYNKTITKNGTLPDSIDGENLYFYVDINDRVATHIDDPVEVINVTAKIEKSYVNDSSDYYEDDSLFGIGAAFIYGLISSIIAFGCVYLGSNGLDETKGQVVFALGFIIPIALSIATFFWAGVVQGIIITIFSVLEIIGSIAYMSKR